MEFFKPGKTFKPWQKHPASALLEESRKTHQPSVAICASPGFGKTVLWSYFAFLLSKERVERKYVLCICPCADAVRLAIMNTLSEITVAFKTFQELRKKDRGKVDITSGDRLTVVFTSIQKLNKEKDSSQETKLVHIPWLLVVVEEADTTMQGDFIQVVKNFSRQSKSALTFVYSRSTVANNNIVSDADLKEYQLTLPAWDFSSVPYDLTEKETMQLGCLQRRRVSYSRSSCVLCPFPFTYTDHRDRYRPLSLIANLRKFVSDWLDQKKKPVLIWVVDPDLCDVVEKVLGNKYKPLVLDSSDVGTLKMQLDLLERQVGCDASRRTTGKVVVAVVDEYAIGVNGLQFPVVLFLQCPRDGKKLQDCMFRSVRQGASETVRFYAVVPGTSLYACPASPEPFASSHTVALEERVPEVVKLVSDQVDLCTGRASRDSGVCNNPYTKHLERVEALCARFPGEEVEETEVLVDWEVSCSLLEEFERDELDPCPQGLGVEQAQQERADDEGPSTKRRRLL